MLTRDFVSSALVETGFAENFGVERSALKYHDELGQVGANALDWANAPVRNTIYSFGDRYAAARAAWSRGDFKGYYSGAQLYTSATLDAGSLAMGVGGAVKSTASVFARGLSTIGRTAEIAAPSVSRYSQWGAVGDLSARAPVQFGDVMTYGESRARALVGDGLTGDHMPSYAAIRSKVEATLERPLTRAEESVLRNNTNVVIVGQDLHEAGRTYFGANTSSQIALDSTDLSTAALQDQALHLQNAPTLGYDPFSLQSSFDKLNELNAPLFQQLETRQSTLNWFQSLGLYYGK